jgi:hypothetical protein
MATVVGFRAHSVLNAAVVGVGGTELMFMNVMQLGRAGRCSSLEERCIRRLECVLL